MNKSSKKNKGKNSARAAKNREKKETAKRNKEKEKLEALEELNRDSKHNKKIRSTNNGGDDDQLFSAVTSGCFVDVENVLKKENETCSQEALDKCLLIAAKTGQKLTLTLLLKAGANSNYCDENGDTPLMFSAEKGYVDIARILVANKADKNAINCSGYTALLRSVHSRSCADLTRLLVSSTNVNMKDQEGRTALIKAILKGDIDVMKVLVINGADTENLSDDESIVDTIDKSGMMKFIYVFRDCNKPAQPSLIAAMQTRDIDVIETILTSEPDSINLRSSSGGTALDTLLTLIISKKSGIFEVEKNIIRLLISRGIDVIRKAKNGSIARHRSGAGDSTLVKAVQVGDLDVVKWMCMFGAQVNDPVGYDQLTPLMMASREGHLEILNYLLLKQATVEVRSKEGTALDIAVKSGHLDCAQRLLEEKAKKNLKEAYKTAIEYKVLQLVKYLVETFAIDLTEMCFMEWAIDSGKKEILEYLIELGMDVNSNLPSQQSYYRGNCRPIHLCVKKTNLDFVQVMLRHNADINVTDSNGETALFYACTLNDVSILKALLQSGADVNAVNKSGKTAIFSAVDNKKTEHVKILLEYGADVNIFDDSRDTPLSRAIDAMSFEIVCMLLDNNADTGAILSDRKTYLMHALRSRNYYSYYDETKQIFKKLLEYKIDVNRQDDKGNTPLIKASESSAEEAVELLLNHDADVNVRNNVGETALSYSIKTNNNITKMLLKKKAKFLYPRECQQAIHFFLYGKKEDLIYLTIGHGVYPYMVKAGYSSDKMFSSSYLYGQDLTPLSITICEGRMDLAEYFIKRRFLTKYDVTDLLSKDFFQKNSAKIDQGVLFKSLLSLQTLAFIVISDLLGATPEREMKVEKLSIPNKIKQQLLFRDRTFKCQ